MDTYVILTVIIILGIFSKNVAVWLAAALLFLFRLIPSGPLLMWTNQYAMKIGIAILTMGVLAPIALGEITLKHLKEMAVSGIGIFALIVGVLVAYLGGRGMGFLTGQPQIVTGLMIGTILGVAFFRGVPVGPLIAAGILTLFAGMFK